MKTVKVEVRQAYGVNRIYPVNEEADLFSFLTGKKTFDTADLNFIKNLGFVVEEVVSNKLESMK